MKKWKNWFPLEMVEMLVKDPSKIERWGQARRVPCKVCGRPIWGTICRKCRRQRVHRIKKTGKGYDL
jgi:hypothetical protein